MEWKECLLIEMNEQALHSIISSEWTEMDETTRMTILKQGGFDEFNPTT